MSCMRYNCDMNLILFCLPFVVALIFAMLTLRSEMR